MHPRLALLATLPLLLTLLLPAPCLAAESVAPPAAGTAAVSTIDPDMDEGHRQFAHANYEKALEHYLKTLERHSEDAYLHFRIGLTYYMLDDLDNFERYWNSAMVLNTNVAYTLISKVNTEVMSPTLIKGDTIITDDKYYNYIDFQHGDVIDFDIPNMVDKSLASRIVGLHDDSIDIVGDALYINNKLIREISEKEKKQLTGAKSGNKIIVPEGCYYVIGDFKGIYSKRQYIGCVQKEKIVGKVLLILGSEEQENGKSKSRDDRFGMIVN